MTEQEALAMSTGYVRFGPYIGYLPLRAANTLVRTGRYVFEQSTCWGYVVKRERHDRYAEEAGA